MKNKPVSAIEINENIAREFIKNEIFDYENLSLALKDCDLTKYKKGFPLKYPRQEFILDFNSAIKDLKPNGKNRFLIISNSILTIKTTL